MQLDMHYHGTYAMARAAGINHDAAEIIATASQYVDDVVVTKNYECQDGSCIAVQATGHHSADVHNILPIDQRTVWIPFHFLPGNEGEDFSNRLLCKKDSAIAKEIVNHNLTLFEKPFACELVGITAHVYADTFSHYGFSGISSELNCVNGKSIDVQVEDPETRKYITDKAERFFKKYGIKEGIWAKIRRVVSGTAETLSRGLGHGAVATYPDRPYLRWSFDYEKGGHPINDMKRDNRVTYLEACKALHEMFVNFVKSAPKYSDTGSFRPFSDIKDAVFQVLSLEKDQAGRIAAWQKAVIEGSIFNNVAKEGIPSYGGDSWDEQLKNFNNKDKPSGVTAWSVYRFHQAASLHRHAVLREILPSKGLMVV